jgi:TetR/AcrR family transcriptional repressor of nem operon
MGRPRNFEADVVVDRAMEAFWTHGYASTSPAQLAECTGVAKGSLYNAFGSKRELFERALDRYDRMGVEITTDFMSRPRTTREIIGDYLRSIADSDAADPGRGCLVANTALELGGRGDEIDRILRTMTEHNLTILAERIDQGRRDGDVSRDTDPRAAAEFLLNTLAGLRIMAKGYDRQVLHRIIDTALTTL